ncbi:MAG: amidophosphoribosyltransferase, partial [Tissierellales bacterium]
RVVLVDDSIVRGTTIRRIIDLLRKAGAREIHVRVSSPPVRNAGDLALDTIGDENLLAKGKTVEEIRKELGADSLYYLSLKGLIKAVGENIGFCTGCFNGKYAVEKMR